jgi:nitrate reductase gamma subunit
MFAVFPYVAMVLLLVISVLRYRLQAYTVSSLSSQFLESQKLFWGSVSLHLGIITLFFGHLIGFLIPREVQAFAGSPLRLLVMELSGFVAGLLFLVGLVLLILRRLGSSRLKAVTSRSDLLVYVLLLAQAGSGLYIATQLRWGTAWYVQVAVPYLRSLFVFQPDIQLMTDVPLAVQLHVLGAFTLFAVFSFTRLMHILVAPVGYLWRTTQLVIWNRDRRTLRSPLP